ncbi:MAG: hypothetical protein U0900_22880 [Myxococcota bacterium]
MTRRRSLAVAALMVVLTFAPSLALAASVCAPQCCPAAVIAAPDAADRAAEDCRAGFANRSCCNESAAPIALAGTPVPDAPAPNAPLLPGAGELEATSAAWLRAPARHAEAQRALRISPLRLSVVLRI